MAGVVALLGFLVRALLTGEDIPTNFQIIIGGIFGLALGSAGLSNLVGGKKEDKKEDRDG